MYSTPGRSRSSLGYYGSSSSSVSTHLKAGPNGPGSLSKTQGKPTVADMGLRRPPSRGGFLGSGGASSGTSTPTLSRSRPGSAMGYHSSSVSGVGSRPGTPSSSAVRSEPYTGSITVSIRPNPGSAGLGNTPPAWNLGFNSISNVQDQSSFTFDNVFLADRNITTNLSVYQEACSHIVSKFLYEGFNGTVFAYGMTGSGKTYSMKGVPEDPGFVKLAIDDIFTMLENDALEKIYKLSVNYLEIYNEKIIDLFADGAAGDGGDLKIRDDPLYGNKIIGITSPEITSKDQLLALISRGDNNRKTSATDFNARSSRSHSILQLKLNTIDTLANTDTHSILSLCDLAGSERATSSLERRKEGAYINKSLLALSTIINKLSASSLALASSGSTVPISSDHIPYRDSKLTRLLQPALSGSSVISILCTIHLGSFSGSDGGQSSQFVSETYNTLRFAARARNIVMNVNKSKTSAVEGLDARMVEELRKTIELQRAEISSLKTAASKSGNGHSSRAAGSVSSVFSGTSDGSSKLDNVTAQLQGENAILNEKLEHLTRLTDLQKTETIILKNDILNDVLGANVDNNSLQVMMANLEEFYKRVNYEIDEHKSYINHLEHQLKSAQVQLLLLSLSQSLGQPIQTQSVAQSSKAAGIDIDAVLKDQEDEIWQLKEQIKDKDHIIKSLTKTSKLRRLMESNSSNISEESDRKPIVRMALSDSGKENIPGEMKNFKIGSGKRSPRENLS